MIKMQVGEVGHDMEEIKLTLNGTTADLCKRGNGLWNSIQVNVLTRLRIKP
jgi:hypothetical protein